jgi:hypothetical protein
VENPGQAAIFTELPDIIARHQKATLRAFPKWSTRWKLNGKRVERTPSFISFTEYAQELKMIRKTSEDLLIYLDPLFVRDRQAGKLGNIPEFHLRGCLLTYLTSVMPLTRDLAILYDDMTKVFDQNLKELRTDTDSKDGTIDPMGIQASTERAKGLKDRLRAILPTEANTRGNV